MTSRAAVPTRRSLRLVPTIVALCPKQLCEAAAAGAPRNARALTAAIPPSVRTFMNQAMAKASAPLAERSVTAKGYLFMRAADGLAGEAPSHELRRGRGPGHFFWPAGCDERTRLSTAVRTPCEHQAVQLCPSVTRRVARISMEGGFAGHSMLTRLRSITRNEGVPGSSPGVGFAQLSRSLTCLGSARQALRQVVPAVRSKGVSREPPLGKERAGGDSYYPPQLAAVPHLGAPSGVSAGLG
jgi:hypothetical protein